MGGRVDDGDNRDLQNLVAFRLGDRLLAFPVDDVREVVPMAWLSKPPQLPAMVEGILNLAGQAVPILRLDRLLSIEAGDFGLEASILVMKGGGAAIGVMVEHLDGVWPAGRYRVMPVDPQASFNGCLSAMLDSGVEAIGLLSWQRLLLAEERARIAEFTVRAQARLGGFEDASTC